MGTEPGSAPRTIRDVLVSAVQQTPIGKLLENPPHALHVVDVESGIGSRIIEPITDTFREFFPLLLIGKNRLAACRVELRDAESLDFGLARDSESLLGLDLDAPEVR